MLPHQQHAFLLAQLPVPIFVQVYHQEYWLHHPALLRAYQVVRIFLNFGTVPLEGLEQGPGVLLEHLALASLLQHELPELLVVVAYILVGKKETPDPPGVTFGVKGQHSVEASRELRLLQHPVPVSVA